MIRNERMFFGPYLNETYHGNYIYIGQPLGNQLAEGIMIMYVGNPFGLKDYQRCEIDKDGNLIK